MAHATLEQAILEFVGEPGYRPLKPRAIAKRLACRQGQLDEVKRAVKRLVRRGQLAYGANHLVQAGARPRERRPRLRAAARRRRPRRRRLPPHAKGLRLRAAARRATAGAGSHATKPAAAARLHAARRRARTSTSRASTPATPPAATSVLVRAASPRREPAAAGKARAARSSRSSSGRPGSSSAPISSPAGAGLRARSTARCSPSRSTWAIPAQGARPDDKVVFEMVRFPSPVHDGEGVIIEVLGPRGKPGVDTLSIIREFNLPDALRRRRPGRGPPGGREVRRSRSARTGSI